MKNKDIEKELKAKYRRLSKVMAKTTDLELLESLYLTMRPDLKMIDANTGNSIKQELFDFVFIELVYRGLA